MRFKKIPRRCLIHTVILAHEISGTGAFGKPEVVEKGTVRRVRFSELRSAVNVSGTNEEYSVSAVLIHQPGISDDCTFTVGEYIIFRGQLYRIVEVTGYDELERYHHTEVKLSYVDCYTPAD